ncbi:hypothetical protein BCU30_018615 [Vibrio lentus]|uniref:hypothetical protein n=1 Tax=Vibrio lentus TaxID=136468 RepID=UPI000C818F37|nr:hypothetical protein [Vibrio lentus]PMG25426.1 hypothetical protein BCU96_00305 [Vibrio lentus]PMH16818.1 hypothetical protein BCU76_00305 [Vibrio lentus]PMJ07072.1 hypothetical protein BCU30_11610 [Vibrio lentus]PMK87478.1 hypothetical protein BCT89_04840 [Vibrio lentus]PMN14512.1 hypothetical protein BCT39_06775 [Vibrio lentus]
MLNLLKKVALINLTAALVVLALSQFFPFFATTRLVDFLFFVVIVIWVLAKLMWEGGVNSKTTRLDDPITDKVYKMVEGHDFDKDQQEHYRMNYHTGLVLFIAGLPAFIACFVLQFL